MLNKLLNFFDPNRRDKNSEKVFSSKYSLEQLPFLLNYEHHCIAWGEEHYGEFILPNGDILEYNKPDNWTHFKSIIDKKIRPNIFRNRDTLEYYNTDSNSLINGKILPNDLLKNLSNCKMSDKKVNFDNFNFSEAILNIEKGDLEPISSAEDWGLFSYSIIFYDSTINLFKRIILYTYGDAELLNKSTFTDIVLKYFYQSSRSNTG